MATNVFMKIDGIRGPVNTFDLRGAIEINAVQQNVSSGFRQVSDRRRRGTAVLGNLIVTKDIDQTSPSLMRLLLTQDRIPKVELGWWESELHDSEIQFYTIELNNAFIVRIKFEKLNNQDPQSEPFNDREHVSFGYDEIRWKYNRDQISEEVGYDVRSARPR